MGAPNSAMMPSPVYWLTVPSKRWMPSARICEEAVEDAVPLFGVYLLGQLHRAFHIREQHRHVLALALERRARGQDLVGQVLGGVGQPAVASVARGVLGECGYRARNRARPDERATLAACGTLDIDQLFDDFREVLALESKLAAECALRNATVLFEKLARAPHVVEEAHVASSPASWSLARTAPISRNWCSARR